MPDNFNPREAQLLQAEAQALQNQMAEIVDGIERLQETKKTLESMKSTANQQVMIPLGGGAFVEGTIKTGNEILMNLGANAYAKKSSDEAIELLDKRINILKEVEETVDKRLREIMDKLSGF